MKRVFLFLLIFQILTFPVLSHPGRTDSNGGHYNRSTGEYHYHNGEYAGRTQSSSSKKEQSYFYTPPKKEIEIEIIKPTDEYFAGETYTFSAEIPEEYSQSDVKWTTDDENIGTFDGAVLTLKKSGYIQITATLKDAETHYSLVVRKFKFLGIMGKIILYSVLIGFYLPIICDVLDIFTKKSQRTVIFYLVCLLLFIIPILFIVACGIINLYYKYFLLK